MNNEIKEILDKLKDGNWYNELDLTGTMWIELRWEETHLLLDYITNLQKENERLKKLEYKFIDTCGENESFTLEEYLDIGNKLYDIEREKEDYKSRVEKAVDYIDYYWISLEDSKKDTNYEVELEVLVKEINDLYNILNGDDKE